MARVYDPTDYGRPTDLREGVSAGLIGAAVVALFYLVFDIAIRGQALITPTVLGEVLVMQRPDPDMTAANITSVAAYTVVHVIAFALFGIVLAMLVARSERSALARYATLQLMIVFLLFFYGVLYVVSATTAGAFPFLSVLAANALAALAMGRWLWMRHPAARGAWGREPLGAAPEKDVVTTGRQS
ncbi:MAG: hypothetical protein H0W15_04405 [Gemmatimonadales bacterium]|nr:hypothetical protein [Gemmatimonadales bacterium]